MSRPTVRAVHVSSSRAWLIWALGAALFGYGFWVESANVDDSAWLYAFFLLISLMHFWYDSFVWSVAKKQV